MKLERITAYTPALFGGISSNELDEFDGVAAATSFFTSLSEDGLYHLFMDWVVQIWLYENEVPNDEKALAEFQIEKLVPEFQSSYINGDFQYIKRGRGATIDEFFFMSQIKFKEPQILFINTMRSSELPRLAQYEVLGSYDFNVTLMTQFINLPKTYEGRMSVLLRDGEIAHLVNVIGVTSDQKDVIYLENGWPDGKSFFSPGENSLNTHAVQHHNSFVWTVDAFQFSYFMYAFIIPVAHLPRWRELIRDVQVKHEAFIEKNNLR